ncbi:MAG: glycoside hydrolase family 24 [Proteobacteria bacterium]|nr:glycoside hydrolase family 24 [Pseudomonadota bacterium]
MSDNSIENKTTSNHENLAVTPVAAAPTNTVTGSQSTGSTDRLAKPWKVTDKLLRFIGIWENGVENGKNFAKQTVTNGFILTVYNDSRNLPTVGCGHLVTTEDKLKLGDSITIEKAKDILKNDLEIAEKAINEKVKVPLYQNEYDALVSVTFNTGRSGALKLIDKVNEGDYKVVPKEIEKYRTGGGNKGRRASEASLFESGNYDATH